MAENKKAKSGDKQPEDKPDMSDWDNPKLGMQILEKANNKKVVEKKEK